MRHVQAPTERWRRGKLIKATVRKIPISRSIDCRCGAIPDDQCLANLFITAESARAARLLTMKNDAKIEIIEHLFERQPVFATDAAEMAAAGEQSRARIAAAGTTASPSAATSNEVESTGDLLCVHRGTTEIERRCQ